MRHDPASAAIVVMLRSLKMYGMAQAVDELIEQGAPAFDTAVPILSQLLKAELAEREVRSIAYHLKGARFPAYKDLTGFDFASSEINEASVQQLHRGSFMEGADNVVLIGGPGTGKTHVATALGAFHGIRPSIPRASGRPFHEHPATLVRGLQGFSSFWISVSAVKGVGGAEGCPREGPACPAPRPPRGWR